MNGGYDIRGRSSEICYVAKQINNLFGVNLDLTGVENWVLLIGFLPLFSALHIGFHQISNNKNSLII